MKKLSVVFAAIAVLLSDIMCAVVSYSWCKLRWEARYLGGSAPESIALFYLIPFGIGIAVAVILSIAFYKKCKTEKFYKAP